MSLFAPLLGVLDKILGFFRKTPEEKERQRLGDKQKKSRKDSEEIRDAIREAQKSGNGSFIERIINRR